MGGVEVSGLYVHYIKSCATTALDEMYITEEGPELDRHWMLVRPSGDFVSQRDFAKLALVRPKLERYGLEVEAPEKPKIIIPTSYSVPLTQRVVTVWGNTCLAEEDHPEASMWFSEYLNTECTLVHVAPGATRNKEGSRFGFADSYPLTIESEESWQNLLARIDANGGTPIEDDRTRSNIRVKGCEAYEEDTWAEIFAGLAIAVIKPVVRCKIPQINQQTAQLGKEPARTLAKYRTRITVGPDGGKINEILFAQKARQLTTGRISMRDEVIVYTRKAASKFVTKS